MQKAVITMAKSSGNRSSGNRGGKGGNRAGGSKGKGSAGWPSKTPEKPSGGGRNNAPAKGKGK